MRYRLAAFVLGGVGALLLAGCGGDGDDTCTVGTSEGCMEGMVCEQVQGSDQPACFAPLEVRGQVFDATDDAPIEGARVVALDANGGARSEVVFTAMDGTYTLPISVPRDADGNPRMESVTLRVTAAGYQKFPTAPRTALPIDLQSGSMMDGTRVVQNAATDVAMIPLSEDTSGYGSIAGTVEHEEPGGVLVVAEQGGSAVSTAVTDTNGSFTLFNVPSGETSLDGYRAGLDVEAKMVSVPGGESVMDVVLSSSTEGLTTVSGSVEIVDAPGDAKTSVILVVESTFDETFVRGEAPAGLRAGNVTGAWEIEGVPPGRYVVLAAFENDGLVRDPDEGIAGTSIVHIEVTEGEGTKELSDSFKVTGALAVRSPGAEGLEVISASEPTFEWADDASEDAYEVRVYNAYGEMVHENTMIGGVTGSDTVSYTWSGASLEDGMVYQFRAWSRRDRGGGGYISATENLRGVFMYAP